MDRGQKGQGEEWQNACVSSGYILRLRRTSRLFLNSISPMVGGKRLCHLWQRSRLATVLLGDSDRSREYCNMALNVVHSPLIPW